MALKCARGNSEIQFRCLISVLPHPDFCHTPCPNIDAGIGAKTDFAAGDWRLGGSGGIAVFQSHPKSLWQS